jgi:hypothetical protein
LEDRLLLIRYEYHLLVIVAMLPVLGAWVQDQCWVAVKVVVTAEVVTAEVVTAEVVTERGRH